MRTERDPKIFERKVPFIEPSSLQNILFQTYSNPSKIDGGFSGINFQTKHLTKSH